MKRRNPASDGTLGGAGNTPAGKQCDPFSNLATRQPAYWVEGRTEFWRIPNTAGRKEDGDIIYLSPPGKGWFACVEDRGDDFTIWQRRRRRS
jgi:hypothetical protein